MNADRKYNSQSQTQDEINERQILDLLRERTKEEENQPMLQAANPIDADKNHREYRDYMMKL